MNGAGKGVSRAKSRFYCYCGRGDGYVWELFEPKHESAAVDSISDLHLHLIRIQVLKKDVAVVLYVSLSGKAPKKLVRLGPKPKKAQLEKMGIKLHKVVSV
ncbi:MAG: hypothetical protein NT116_04230 [Candidatus Parcubacteria bacterium]|nr:hypothetical protein [Candidatus Parcubacteria bacterium]